jgi:hypothetical protein
MLIENKVGDLERESESEFENNYERRISESQASE